jgi:hypothetical protein
VRNLCLTLSRFTIAAWVGAAALFVVTTLSEVHSPNLDSVAKAELAVLRFPAYYMFAFGLVAAALILSACWPTTVSKLKRWTASSLLMLILILTGIDYVWIYTPLVQMTAAVDEARPAAFVSLHETSKWINTSQICVSIVAALTVCWPGAIPAEASRHK